MSPIVMSRNLTKFQNGSVACPSRNHFQRTSVSFFSIKIALFFVSFELHLNNVFLLHLQYEKHEEKVDPAHAHRHHVEAQVAEAAALGLGGYALYEHHEAKKIHKQESHLEGGHRHGHHHGHHRN